MPEPHPSAVEHDPREPHGGLLGWWHGTPLYLRILGALLAGVVVGLVLQERAAALEVPSKLILRLLGALAPALILIAVVQALMTANLGGRQVSRLVGLLILNTVVAIGIGMLVANVVRPGHYGKLQPEPKVAAWEKETDPETRELMRTLDERGIRPPAAKPTDPLSQFLDNIPRSLVGPLSDDGKVIGVIFIAVAFGVALRKSRYREVRTLEDLIQIAFDALLTILHWIIDLVPIGVFGIVAGVVGTRGFAPFIGLAAFIAAVLIALVLQATWYLARVRMASWVRPLDLIRGTRDALIMAFSTASSTITMPVTYSCLRDRVGVREQSASMGALVGANFNNDGTALYEAMSALFVAQMLGMNLEPWQQLLVVITSVVASVGAAGIPEAGLVTMTLVFTAVKLPTEYIALLFTVDWFLDRCRTAINVMGDTNVSCLLDGKVRETPATAAPAAGAT